MHSNMGSFKSKVVFGAYGFLLWGITAFGQSTEELKARLKQALPDTVRLQVLTDLNWLSMATSPAEAKGYAIEELKLAQKAKLPRWEAQAYNDLGLAEQQLQHFSPSLAYHQKALAIRQKLGDSAQIGSSWSKIGYCYSEMNQLDKALQAQLKALLCFRRVGSARYISYTLNNICYIYNELKQYDLLEPMAQESYTLSKELGDGAGMVAALNYQASAFENKKKWPEALSLYRESLQIALQLQNADYEGTMLNNLGTIFSRLNRLDSAEKYYRRAYTQALARADVNGVVLYGANLAHIHTRQNRMKSAKSLLAQSLAWAQRHNMNLHLSQVYLNFGAWFSAQCEADSANKYYALSQSLVQDKFSEKMAKELSSLQTRYELESREQQKRILAQNLELERNKLLQTRYGLAFLGILVVALLGFFLFWRNRQRILNRQRMALEVARQQELRLKAVWEAEEKERRRIARDLHDGVGQQLSAAKLNLSGIKAQEANPKNLDSLSLVAHLVDKAVLEVRSVSHALMAQSQLKEGLPLALRQIVHDFQQVEGLEISLEIFGMPEKLDPGLEMVLFRIAQELLQNVVKHAAAQRVDIQLIGHEDCVVLMVEDNGRGFQPEQATKGLGFSNIRERLAPFHGRLEIDSQPSKGTVVTVEVAFKPLQST